MAPEYIPFLTFAVMLIAFLYSSVGHAGASGYIAAMTLAGMTPTSIRSTALVLNLVVATIASLQFQRAGHFQWRLFWPFALMSVPLAFLGGYLRIPAPVMKNLLGMVLLYSAARFLISPREGKGPFQAPAIPVALGVGGSLGFLAGLTGTGGGIFLTPILLLMKWARTKTAAATSALFILVNSGSGLLGNVSSTRSLPSFILPLGAAVLLGGTIGSFLGSRHFSPTIIRLLLAVVLVIAGLKLILT